MKWDVHVSHDEDKNVWYVHVGTRNLGPFYMKDTATDIAHEIKRVVNSQPEMDGRQAAHDAWEEERRLAAIEREKERERQREARERAEEERQEKLRARILRAMMLSDIDPMDFDAIVYSASSSAYGRSRDWRVAVYADEHVELLDEESSSRWRDGTPKGKAIADTKEEHEERVISIAQDFESARFERRGSKPDREYDIKWQVYENGAQRFRRNSTTKGRLRHMYVEDVEGNHGWSKKKGDVAYALGRAREGVGPARFDTKEEAEAWRDKHDEYGIVDSIKIPIKKEK